MAAAAAANAMRDGGDHLTKAEERAAAELKDKKNKIFQAVIDVSWRCSCMFVRVYVDSIHFVVFVFGDRTRTVMRSTNLRAFSV